jgi:anti-sigma regulatory factor (Ser/Thr protein kinase)/Na+-translocating ferredoxin:NAD+ oxidoreductase RNF subunit RnfB
MEFVSYSIADKDFATAGRASRAIKEHLKRIGADSDAIRRTMIAAYEAEMNVVIHADGGRLEAKIGDHSIDVTVIDRGPGIPDIEQAMREGFSTANSEARALGFGAGLGLPNIRKNSDRIRVSSTPGEGTRVSFTVNFTPESVAAAPRLSLYASVDRCTDCRRCISRCPTKAVRVRDGRPMVLDHLCIECTCCMAACAPRAFTMEDELTGIGDIFEPERTVLAVPAGFVAGFAQHCGPAGVLRALDGLGFAGVELVAPYSDALLDAVIERADAQTEPRLPLIAPSCPAVVNLIELRFPSLLPQLAPFGSPWEALALTHSKSRIVFVAACPSQRTALMRLEAAGPRMGRDAHPGEAGASGHGDRRWRRDEAGDWHPGFAWEFITPELLAHAVLPLLAGHQTPAAACETDRAQAAPSPLSDAGAADQRGDVLRVTGVDHVIAVLEQVENGLIRDVGVLDPYICDRGCFGSPLLPADPYLSEHAWLSYGPHPGALGGTPEIPASRPYAPRPGIRLDADMSRAVAKLARLQEVVKSLPGKDCGACGAPSCASLAEDVVMERAVRESCPYLDEEVTT